MKNSNVYNESNKVIRAWGRKTHQELLRSMYQKGIRHRPNSPSPRSANNSVLLRFRTAGGKINRIGFLMPRHMIYVHKGVGRDTPIEKVGQTNRKAKEWYNPVIERNINDLADKVALAYGDSILNKLAID